MEKQRVFQWKSMAFERWQHQLWDLLLGVQTKRHQYNEASNACQILLGPWPKKLQEDKEAEIKECENKNISYVQENQHNQQEEVELKFVNDLLFKAQKTRVKISSKRTEEHARTTCKELPMGKSEKLQWEMCESEAANVPETGVMAEGWSNFRSMPVIDTGEKSCQSSGNVGSGKLVHGPHLKQHPQTQTNKKSGRIGSAHGLHTAPGKNVHPSVSKTAKPTFVGNATRSKSVESAQSLWQQPRPISSRGKVKPAHMTAPFKTDQNMHAPRRQTPRTTVPAVIKRISSKKHKQVDTKHQKNYLETESAKFQGKVLPPISSESVPSPTGSPDLHLNDVCITPFPSDREEMENCGVPDEGQLNSEIARLTILDNSVIRKENDNTQSRHPVEQYTNEEGEQDTKQFSLLSDGGNLNIPPKVRRAFAKNQKLRNKVLRRDASRKPMSGSYDKGKEFVDKLQLLFDSEEEVIYRQQALECLYTHQRLEKVLLSLNLDNFTDSSSTSDILRTRLMAEFLLSSFSAYADDANLLSKVQFTALPPVTEPCARPAVYSHGMLLPERESYGLPGTKVQYSNLQDLQYYTGLLLKLQTLQCQLHSLHIVTTDVLPWLCNMDVHQEDFSATFRGIYSVLVADGNHLPALVLDSQE